MNHEYKPALFRGHLEECLIEFAATERKSTSDGGYARTVAAIAAFCGVEPTTVKRWFRPNASRPKGEPLIKLLCCLDAAGYRVIEWERLPKGRRHFAELIGFGLVTSERAAAMLGYTTSSTMYQVLIGRAGASEKKDQAMWDAWKERRDDLERNRASTKLQLTHDAARSTREPSPQTSPVLRSRFRATILLMEGLLALLDDNHPEAISDREFEDLRRSAETVLRLSAHLTTISSRLMSSSERSKETRP
ncbi:MAG TPA: hypothetical protein VN397_02840 [Candidatus Methylomirabilis sp.]|nr:hypothetical protein [Candidatus Methylomirabilis sp.]